MSPESRLAAALIEQALADIREIHGAGGLRKCALEWFGGARAPISFEQACALAGIDRRAAIEAIGRSRGCRRLANSG